MQAVKTNSNDQPTNKPIIFVTGASGMLGQHLTNYLSPNYQVHPLKRFSEDANKPQWNYQESLTQLNIKAPFAVIHLAGAGTADKRWTESYKQTLIQSRVNGTQWLVNEITQNDSQPEVFMCASAIGFYGHRPGEKLTESSESGENFVAKISRQWEQATEPLGSINTRVLNLRFGMILSTTGGALQNMITPFKFGVGGRIGSGDQVYSWIGIDDASRAIEFLMEHSDSSGPYNLTTPYPVSNQVFTKTLAKTLNRPAFMHMPAFAVRLIFGQMADELLLADAKVLPEKLSAAGFKFTQAKLDTALDEIING